jgi:uncharacterized protein YjiS (DUF1127 family)
MQKTHVRHAIPHLAAPPRRLYLPFRFEPGNAPQIRKTAMALLDFSRSPSHSVPGVFTHLVGAMVAWNDARRTRDALSQLSAHELDDIGLSRGDIDMIARGGRY